MRNDANRIALDVCRQVLSAAHDFSFELEGQTVSVSVAPRAPGAWPRNLSDVSEATDGPWPVTVDLHCTWSTGKATLWAAAVVASGAHKGQIALTVMVSNTQLVWRNLRSLVKDLADGQSIAVDANYGSAKRDTERNKVVNQQLRKIVEKSQLPLVKNSVQVCTLTLPGTLSPAPTEIFERFVRLAMIKLPAIAQQQLLDGGSFPYQPVAKIEVDEPEDDSDDSDSPVPVTTPTPTQCENVIYFGPPGTGKTFTLKKLLSENYEGAPRAGDWESWFIADFLPDLNRWELLAIALREIGRAASLSDLYSHPFTRHIPRSAVRESLQTHTVETSKTVNRQTRHTPQIFDKSEQAAWYLAGDWHTELDDLFERVDALKHGTRPVEMKRHTFVTFHQSFGYEEFVEGLRPVMNTDELQYEIRDGAFKKLCERARLDPGNRYAMVIDEINRGNIAKIFGELITLIEPDKREGAAHALSVVLPYSGQSFSVPANVDIIGSMNTADRSLALLDTALRRRFEFKPMWPDDSILSGVVIDGIDISRVLRTLNERIEALFDRDHTIGHAYFTPLKQAPTLEHLSRIFRNKVLPLLEEYFFEDWNKIRLALGDNQKKEQPQFVIETSRDDEKLFGASHGLENAESRKRFEVNDDAFDNAAAYIGIYAPQ